MKIFQKIIEDRKFIFTGLAILFLFFLFLNTKFWHNIVLGLLFTICYLLFVSFWLGKILGNILSLEKGFKFFFGLFLALYLIAFGLAVPIVFYKISAEYFYIFLFFLTTIISFLNRYFQKKCKSTNQDANLQTANNNKEGIKIHSIFYFLFSIFYVLAWFFLFKARTGENLISPWQVISPYYLYIWLVISFLTVFFIFSRQRVITILLIIILSSLLLHAYLPIVQENNFGVDKWRQLGAERRLIFGQIESPALFGEKLSYKNFGPFKIPEVFLAANKTSYSGSWALTIGLSWLTSVDIFWIDMFLIFVLWSVFLPIFTFKLVNLIFKNKKISLLAAFFTLIPFSFQVDGAITLPKTVSFLFFVFFLIIIFEYLKGKKKLLPLIIFFFIVSYFHYILFLILSLEIFIFGLILEKWRKKIWLKTFSLLLLFFIFSLSLILLDRLSGVSFFQYKVSEIREIFPSKLEAFWQKLSQGNYFYFTDKYPGNASFLNLVKLGLFFIPFTWLAIILGIFNFQKNSLVKLLAIFLIILLINQFLSISFMKDYRLLARRATMMVIFLLIIFFSAGIYILMEKIKMNFKVKVVIFSLILSIFSLTTYASGPYNLGTVTRDELAVAKFLWQEIKKSSFALRASEDKVCVFDSGWRLLALESVSGIIAGGFPTDPIDFVQKEKDELYHQMLKNPSKEILDKTLQITGAKKCFFVVNQSWLRPEVFDKIKEILGEPKIINETYIWKYNSLWSR